jgi:glycosyltransferase involved in cell wall biosynthesis
VAVVAYTDYPFDMRIRREVEALAEEGYEVDVLATRSGSSTRFDRTARVQLHQLPITIRRGSKGRYLYQYLTFLLLSAAMLLYLHLRNHFDVVHVHSLPDFQIFCAVPLRLAGVPVFLDLREAMPEIFAARFRKHPSSIWVEAAILLEKLSCQFASHVIVANDGIKAAVVSRGMDPHRTTAVYNVGDDRAELITPSQLRSELGLPSGNLIVHAAGVNEERDLETVIQALSLISTELDAYLIIAGQGDLAYIDRLRVLAARCGFSSRLFFVGRLPLERTKALMSMSLVGLVSLQRNPLTELAWPTRIVEFANLSKPLVVADLPFIRSVLGESAAYYTPGEPRSLASAVCRITNSPEETQSRCIEAERICSKFGVQEMRRNLLEVYRVTLTRHGKRGDWLRRPGMEFWNRGSRLDKP